MARSVAVVGCGTIGLGWAVVFARAGIAVRVCDADAGALRAFSSGLGPALRELEGSGVVADATDVQSRITVHERLQDAVTGADWVQECIPEDPALKLALFRDIERHAPAPAILASSTSSIPPADFLDPLATAQRCLIAHPFNPSYLVPLVELIPSATAGDAVLASAREFLASQGLSPVVLRRAIPGFVGNRLQAAVVSEAINLVQEGIISPDDLDRCMRDGLGPRWAFLGPFETMDLNAPGGFGEYVDKFGQSYQSLAQNLYIARPWRPSTIERIEAARRADVPRDGLAGRRAWRDRALQALLDLKRGLEREPR